MSAEHPDYYTLPNGKQLLDYIKHCSFPIGNVVKYVYRHREKKGSEDLRKALVYLDCLDPQELERRALSGESFHEGKAIGELLIALTLGRNEAADILRPLLPAFCSRHAGEIESLLADLRGKVERALQELEGRNGQEVEA